MTWQWVTLLLGITFAFTGLIVFMAIISRDTSQRRREAYRRGLTRVEDTSDFDE
jgi:cytochrome c oxidase assembly factor CtaG